MRCRKGKRVCPSLPQGDPGAIIPDQANGWGRNCANASNSSRLFQVPFVWSGDEETVASQEGHLDTL